MLEPLQIVAALRALAPSGPLAGAKLLVSAGPTCEDLDPVRFLGNRSSGRMGFAIAAEAAAMGAEVTLVAGPVALDTPPGVQRIDVRRALEMRDAVLAALPGQDVYVGAAAIADYMPAQVQAQKIKKGADTLQLQLVRTPDVLAEVARHAARPRVVVGFAAETEQLEQNALAKLRAKNLDLIAGNDVSAPGLGFGSEENALQVYSSSGRQDIARGPKPVVARALLDLIAARLA
jgi:phosphopantothenoylcysteine decarboxylase/phosphopantothenate--cysteine ligase